MKLSVVIPAYNESASLCRTLPPLYAGLRQAGIDHEIVVVDDSSTDDTQAALARLAVDTPTLWHLRSPNPQGFGFAVRAGLDAFKGDAVVIVMGDGSDSVEDIVSYVGMLEEGYDCVFGSRFLPSSRVVDYPRLKLFLNRVANLVIRMLFRHGYNDTTNAFKAYRREVIDTIQPILSNHFNLTVELPLKAIVRGHTYCVIPISWTNRKEGASKLRLQEMGSRYLFIILYVFLEHHLSRGDYRTAAAASSGRKLRPGLHTDAGARV
jgi:dolichol-phosphate mannosyltransferase